MDKTSVYFQCLAKQHLEHEPPRKRWCNKSTPNQLPPAVVGTYVVAPSTFIPSNKIRLGDDFFNQESSTLAVSLLGKILVRLIDNKELVCGRIVETEAYLGMMDKACHSSHKRSARTEPMFMKPGTIYVYSIYGMYHCFNISSGGEGAAVLLRAIEPLSGFELMQKYRSQAQKKVSRILPINQLCNGPSKLCLSFGITKTLNKIDMDSPSSQIWIEDWSPQPEFTIVTSTRIGLSKKAAEWIDAPLRFYINDSKSVSVTDKSKRK
jgi:DNA-3-methyladenine glycosylase